MFETAVVRMVGHANQTLPGKKRMNETPLDWPQGAGALLAQAEQSAELARMVMSGILHVESWLIENRILPFLQGKGLATLRFVLAVPQREVRTVCLVPLPDGSAFGRTVGGQWLPLDPDEARHAIQHFGHRHAAGNRWLEGIAAWQEVPGTEPVGLSPKEVAEIWRTACGVHPSGFETGHLDRIEAFGLEALDKLFTTPGRLGL
jgi:hypothetical protein